MIGSCKPRQSYPEAYAYAAGSYAVRRGFLLTPDDLRRTPAEGAAEFLIGLVNRGSYGAVSSGTPLLEVVAIVEEAWRSFLARAEQDLPEPFLPYLLRILAEKEYAKAGLAAWSLYGTSLPSSISGPTREYAEYCRLLQNTVADSDAADQESVFADALREGLSVWRAGGLAQESQTVFDLSFVTGTLRSLAVQYAYPAIINYVDSILDTMIAGLALKAKLRSEAGMGLPAEGLFRWIPKETAARLRNVNDRVRDTAWESIQPEDLVPTSMAEQISSAPRYTQSGRMAILAEMLDEAASREISSLGTEPYGVGVIFSYMMDFRREVWSLRRQLRSVDAGGTHLRARESVA
jgi:hypothetical protein